MAVGTFTFTMLLLASAGAQTRAGDNGINIGSILGNLISETSEECTVLAFGAEKSLIQELVSAFEFNNVGKNASPTIIIGNDMKPSLKRLKKDLKCIIGLAEIEHIQEIQKWLLPTHNRQLIIVDTKQATKNVSFDMVQKKHHPIVILKENNHELFDMLVACKGISQLQHINLFNLDMNKWTLRETLDSLDIEKKCNRGFHPLHGQHLTVSFFGMNPNLYFKKDNTLGGVDVDLMNMIASQYKFTYDTIVSDTWFKFFPNRSVGGSLGHLLGGEASVSLQQLFDIAHLFGESTRTMYFSDVTFMEAKPKQIPPYFNIAYCFDIYSWLGVLLSYAFICLSSCIIYWLRRQQSIINLTVTEIFQIMFGIVFQEYFLPVRNHKKLILFEMQRILWVISSMLLVMAFVGNLKSSLILNNYYERTMSIDEIFEKDLPYHSSAAAYDFLNSPSGKNSPTNRRLLCQANKKRSTRYPNSVSPYDTISQVIEKHGGVVIYEVVAFEVAKAKNIKQRMDHPFVLIPEIFKATQWTMAFQKYDPRAEYFDHVITAMTDTGLIDHMFKSRMPYLGMKENVVVEEKTLILEHFYTPLMILAVGFLIASFAMLHELSKGFLLLFKR